MLRKLGLEGNFLNFLNNIYIKPTLQDICSCPKISTETLGIHTYYKSRPKLPNPCAIISQATEARKVITCNNTTTQLLDQNDDSIFIH